MGKIKRLYEAIRTFFRDLQFIGDCSDYDDADRQIDDPEFFKKELEAYRRERRENIAYGLDSYLCKND